MFQFEEGQMYQMPVHFGPCCGPRQGPDGQRFILDGPQESIQHSLVYETAPAAVERCLPKGFSLRSPHIIVTHKMHRNLPWLAGRGYNVTTFNVPVTYCGQKETICGQYQLAIWENHADPILCGREQLGNREALNKLLLNEKYTGRVLLQKTISTGGSQVKNDGFMERYLYSDSHKAIVSDEIFRDVQQKKLQRTNQPEKERSIQLFF